MYYAVRYSRLPPRDRGVCALLVIPYLLFGTTHPSHHQGSKSSKRNCWLPRNVLSDTCNLYLLFSVQCNVRIITDVQLGSGGQQSRRRVWAPYLNLVLWNSNQPRLCGRLVQPQLQNGRSTVKTQLYFISYEWVYHIAVNNYMFRPLSANVRLWYFLLYSKTIQYARRMLLVTRFRSHELCIIIQLL
jgi:hypothetical protein